MTTNRERESAKLRQKAAQSYKDYEESHDPAEYAAACTFDECIPIIEALERDNEHLRRIDDYWEDERVRLTRENEALRKHVEKLQRELRFAIDSDRQTHDHN